MTDPYRHQEPTPPRKPKVFSPFRPMRRAAWFLLVPPQSYDTILAEFILAVPVTIILVAIVCSVLASSLGLLAAFPPLALVLARRWLISSMHLDNDESREWWQSKFLD